MWIGERVDVIYPSTYWLYFVVDAFVYLSFLFRFCVFFSCLCIKIGNKIWTYGWMLPIKLLKYLKLKWIDWDVFRMDGCLGKCTWLFDLLRELTVEKSGVFSNVIFLNFFTKLHAAHNFWHFFINSCEAYDF